MCSCGKKNAPIIGIRGACSTADIFNHIHPHFFHTQHFFGTLFIGHFWDTFWHTFLEYFLAHFFWGHFFRLFFGTFFDNFPLAISRIIFSLRFMDNFPLAISRIFFLSVSLVISLSIFLG